MTSDNVYVFNHVGYDDDRLGTGADVELCGSILRCDTLALVIASISISKDIAKTCIVTGAGVGWVWNIFLKRV